MKKRLLSAALALAMVLTLLPMSAFAATTYSAATASDTGDPAASNPVGKSFTYQATTDYKTCAPVTLEQGKWYWKAPADAAGDIKVYVANSGFIIGTGNSGAWYPNGSTYESKVSGTTAPSSLTLLGSAPSFTRPWPTTVSVDLNGNAFTFSDLNACGPDGDRAMTKITVTDRSYTSGTRKSITIPSTDRSVYSANTASKVEIIATNVDVGTINLKGYGNSVTLNNCAATSITLDGTTVNSSGKTTYTGQTLKLNDKTTSGAISILGDGSTVTLQDTINAPTVDVESNGGSVTVGGYSNIGQITVKNNQQASATANGNIPTVTVNGGTVAGIDTTDSNTTASSSITINRTNNDINISSDIETDRGTVKVTQANTGDITVGAGSLTIGGSNVDIGNVTLGANGATDLYITTANSTFDGFTTTAGGNLSIKSWPTGRDNYYGTLSLDGYKGQGIKGGTFAAATGTDLGDPVKMYWVDTDNLQLIVPVKNPKTAGDVALYGPTELTQAISDIATTAGADPAKPIVVLGQAAAPGTIQLNFGGNPWAFISYNATTGLYLPTRINNTGISKWIVQNGSTGAAQGSSFNAGVKEPVPAVGNGNRLILDSTNTSAEVTKITNATAASGATVENQDVRVRLNGNTIEVSGAVVPAAGGYASIEVDLTTDVIKPDGTVLVLRGVVIDWEQKTGKVAFNAMQPSLDAYGAIVKDGALVLNRGTGATYTVTAKLAVSASDLELAAPGAGEQIVVTVGGKLSGWTKEAKQQLIDDIQTDGTFSFSGNKAMLEAINAAQATITNNNSVTNWIASARDYIWKNGSPVGSSLNLGKHTGNWKDFATVGAATTDYEKVRDNYNAAFIVPYLVVNVTDYNAQSGTLTATLTPYYRVDVSKNGDYTAADAHTVQAGRTLGALTGDMSTPIQVNLGLTASTFNNAYMHLDDTYVYKAAGSTYSIYHAGKTGLGTVDVNGVDGLISMTSTITDRWGTGVQTCPYKYTSLQAAVDDTMPGVSQPNNNGSSGGQPSQVTETMDTITVDGSYKGSCDFTMTGYARKIKVVALGDLPIKCTSQNVDTMNPSGYTYTFQLKRDTAPTGGNITITGVTGGSASVNANPATAGSTVTITLNPAAGYAAAGVSVKDGSGKTVSVSGSGTRYTFTMPSGTATVTPSFSKTQSTTTYVSVGSPNSGSGTASTNTTGQVTPGTTVTVTTTPGAGQRTMGVYVTGATATRTGANTFTFTVPSGYTNVVVTPRFDANNGTLYEDVWSTEYYSNPVRWAVERGITNGESTYRFGSGNTCTREQMVTFLWRAAGSPVVTGVSNPFWDVRAGEYYYNAVLWAVKNGITKGVSANQFGVGQSVTRADAVTFLYRYAGSPNASTNSGFYDVNSREYYAKAVTWANTTGVTNGTTATTFSPSDPCLREQIVTFLYRNATGNRA